MRFCICRGSWPFLNLTFALQLESIDVDMSGAWPYAPTNFRYAGVPTLSKGTLLELCVLPLGTQECLP